MKKTILSFAIMMIVGSISSGAQNLTKAQYNAQLVLEHIERYGSNNLDYLVEDEYTGTPYGNPIFLLGKIYEKNELLIENYALRYNAMEDEIEVKETLYDEDTEIKILSRSPDIYVKIMDDMFVYVPNNEIIENAGYFQVLYVGNTCNLYKKVYKKYYPPKKAQNSFEKDVLAKFADRAAYYLVSQDGDFKEFGSSKKKKMKLFGNQQDQIKKYASKGKLDINDENDLTKIVKYYDAIEASMQ